MAQATAHRFVRCRCSFWEVEQYAANERKASTSRHLSNVHVHHAVVVGKHLQHQGATATQPVDCFARNYNGKPSIPQHVAQDTHVPPTRGNRSFAPANGSVDSKGKAYCECRDTRLVRNEALRSFWVGMALHPTTDAHQTTAS